jgi:hypothetical protein
VKPPMTSGKGMQSAGFNAMRSALMGAKKNKMMKPPKKTALNK